jgi:hypothetical protein
MIITEESTSKETVIVEVWRIIDDFMESKARIAMRWSLAEYEASVICTKVTAFTPIIH